MVCYVCVIIVVEVGMAEGSIIPKLEVALRRPIKTEMQVVYILVELRKLLEHKNKKDAYPALNFYGNWVVHTKLSKSFVSSMNTCTRLRKWEHRGHGRRYRTLQAMCRYRRR